MRIGLKTSILLFLITGALVLFVLWRSDGARAFLFAEPVTQETRGFYTAQRMGCFQCHGHGGVGGIANPHSESGEIPSWHEFSFMMSMRSEAELREWIMDGAPQRLRDSPRYARRKADMAVTMPAYRDVINERQLDDLVAFYHAVSGNIWPATQQAEAGYKAAKEAGCFSCHGLGGRIDVANRGSFSGFIPAWSGSNYSHLVKNDQELIEWIKQGRIPRLQDNLVANYYQQRQTLQMPAYAEKLSAEQLDAITAYIRWLRDPSAAGHAPSYEM